jgi:hypothetical protein
MVCKTIIGGSIPLRASSVFPEGRILLSSVFA